MKKRTKRVIWGTLLLVCLTVFAFILYLYVGFNGNPIEGYRQQMDVIRVYESRYTEEFLKISSSYDYKRNEFSFSLSSKSHPEVIFTTTQEDLNRVDKYAQAQSINYLSRLVSDSLGTDFDQLQYRINVSEKYDSPSKMERDPTTRLRLNYYIVDITWDTATLIPSEVDLILEDMAKRIADHLNTPVGELKIHVGVYDGKNYHSEEMTLN